MTETEIRRLQRIYHLDDLQSLIDNGHAWTMEGSVGRAANSALQRGACFLPEVRHTNAYGTVLNKRSDREEGDSGTIEYSSKYWRHHLQQIEEEFEDNIDFIDEKSRDYLETLIEYGTVLNKDVSSIKEELDLRTALVEKAQMTATLVLEEEGVEYSIEETETGIAIHTNNPKVIMKKIAERLAPSKKATHTYNPLCAPMGTGEEYD